ncbi:MAG: DUF4111 domain-containing protein [bacterium]|nr:DUF4111 domain-containing protein [bacterium]
MEEYRALLELVVRESRELLGDALVGVYLHGSAVMGCFQAKTSDLDLIFVIKQEISDEKKRKFMDRVVKWNAQAPEKGIELSVVRESVCDPFVYPTPFELHFSMAHLDWYRKSPEDYIAKMQGTDLDLAAHFTILAHRGRTLYGKAIGDVFGEVEGAYYWDSIVSDIENAAEEIAKQPVYMTLNLCRVLAYKRERLILSKKEGGEWGLSNLPEQYAGLLKSALEAYRTGERVQFDDALAQKYAGDMLGQIKGG